MIIKFIKMLTGVSRADKLMKMPSGYRSDFDKRTLTPTQQNVLAAMGAKDKAGVERVLAKYGVTTVAELLPLLPKKKINYQRRFMNWLRRLEGSSERPPRPRKPSKHGVVGRIPAKVEGTTKRFH